MFLERNFRIVSVPQIWDHLEYPLVGVGVILNCMETSNLSSLKIPSPQLEPLIENSEILDLSNLEYPHPNWKLLCILDLSRMSHPEPLIRTSYGESFDSIGLVCVD